MHTVTEETDFKNVFCGGGEGFGKCILQRRCIWKMHTVVEEIDFENPHCGGGAGF